MQSTVPTDFMHSNHFMKFFKWAENQKADASLCQLALFLKILKNLFSGEIQYGNNQDTITLNPHS